MSNIKPNFLIVGAAKSGTTSIYKYLLKHPNVYMPKEIKETYFWINNKDILGNGKGFFEKGVVYSPEKYFSLFDSVNKERHQAIGEACNGYLYFYKNAIPNIKKNLGVPKIIIVLRNPVERAYSGYLHLMRENIIDETFEECIGKEQKRMKVKYWWTFNIVDIGFYCNSVQAYLRNFSDVKIMLFDDLKANSDGFMKEVFNFLGVADLGNFTSQKIYNKTGIPKNGYLHNFLNGKSIAKNIFKMITPKKLRYNVAYYIKNKNLYKPEIKKETKDRLRNMYVTDIKALEKLVKRNLDIWLK